MNDKENAPSDKGSAVADKLIAALTPADPAQYPPPYLNATALADGTVRVTLRSGPKDGNVTVAAVFSAADWAGFASRAAVSLSDDQIKHMVGRFLAWRLPENFRPDAGITFKPDFNEHTQWPGKHQPVGTNLFDATQAEAMVRHMIEGLPPAA